MAMKSEQTPAILVSACLLGVCCKYDGGSNESEEVLKLKEKYHAVILSIDEVTFDLINNEQGDFYNILAARVNMYLRKKAVEISKAGANIILDWGFWTKDSRVEISDFLKLNNVPYEWHYIDVPDALWQKNIAERNRKIFEGKGRSDFFVDKGLLKKLLSMFEIPEKSETGIWYKPQK